MGAPGTEEDIPDIVPGGGSEPFAVISHQQPGFLQCPVHILQNAGRVEPGLGFCGRPVGLIGDAVQDLAGITGVRRLARCRVNTQGIEQVQQPLFLRYHGFAGAELYIKRVPAEVFMVLQDDPHGLVLAVCRQRIPDHLYQALRGKTFIHDANKGQGRLGRGDGDFIQDVQQHGFAKPGVTGDERGVFVLL